MIVAARCRFCRLERRWHEMPGTRALVPSGEAGRNCQAPGNDNNGVCRPPTDAEIASDDLAAATRRRLLFGKSRQSQGQK